MIEKMNGKILAVLVVEILIVILIALGLTRPITNITLTASDIYENGGNGITELTQDNTLVLASGGESCWIGLGTYDLDAGAYRISATYDAHKYDETLIENLYEYEAMIHFSSDTNPTALTAPALVFNNQDRYVETNIWVNSPIGVKDVSLHMFYEGTGVLVLESIQIQELYSYRIITLLKYLLVIVSVNTLWYVCFASQKASLGRNKRIVFFSGTALFASLLVVGDMLFFGHDLPFHLSRITSLAKGLEYGQFPVRIVTEYGNNYGYAHSLFYCDIFLYLPAILYNCGLQVRTCYQIYVILVNVSTLGIAYYAFSRMSKEKTSSLVIAAIYTLSAYRLLCAYTRAALGENTAMIFLPLIVAGVYCIYTEAKPRFSDWGMLAFGMSGILLSHSLSSQIVVVFLVITCLMLLKITWRPQVIMGFLKAAGLSVLLTCWYLIPFLQSMSMPVMVNDSSAINKIQSTGIYLVQLFGIFPQATGLSGWYGFQNEASFTIGFSLVLGTIVIVYTLLHYKEWKEQERGTFSTIGVLGILTVIAVAFTLKNFPWDSTEEFLGETVAKLVGTIQFSWRYLSIVTVGLSSMLLFALLLIKKYKSSYYKPIVVGILVSAIIYNGSFYNGFLKESDIWQASYHSSVDEMNIFVPEYFIQGMNTEILGESYVKVQSDAVIVTDYECRNQTTTFQVENGLDQTTMITVPIIRYDNYKAFDQETGESFTIVNGENNLIGIELEPHYEGIIQVEYEEPFLWGILEGVSALTMIAIIGYVLMSALELSKGKMEIIDLDEEDEEKEEENESSIS